MIQMFYTSVNPFLFLIIVKLTFVNSDDKLGVCSSSHQISALDVQKAHGCEPRHELIQIEIPPNSNIIQVQNFSRESSSIIQRVIFMEDHIPIRPDGSLLLGRQTSKWSLLFMVFP